MKYRNSVVATGVLLALTALSNAWAQKPGVVYPTISTGGAQENVDPSKRQPAQNGVAINPAAMASAAAGSSGPSKYIDPAKRPQASASSQEAQNAPAKFVDPRRLDLVEGVPMPTLGAEKAEPTKKPVVKPREQVLDQGPKVYKAQVSGEMARAEALALAEVPMPSFKPSGRTGASLVPDVAGVAGLEETKPLPKWVTGSLDKTSGRTKVLVLPGVTEIVRIARNFPNRFVTPFESAEVVTTDENLQHDGAGGAVIVATASDKPIGIFLQDRNSDRAIPLVLIPEDIPQREVRLELDETWPAPVLRNIPEMNQQGSVPSAQSDYVEFIKTLMRGLAKGEVPDGHAMTAVQPENLPACQIPGLQIRLGQMLEGTKTRIGVYTARNASNSTIPVQEAGCYRGGVLAVSAFPKPVLEPGQETELYVVVRKEAPGERANSSKRRPILVQE